MDAVDLGLYGLSGGRENNKIWFNLGSLSKFSGAYLPPLEVANWAPLAVMAYLTHPGTARAAAGERNLESFTKQQADC